jgi:hypothetical protein
MRKGQKKARPAAKRPKARVYTLEVFLIGGPVTERFTRKNPVVSRTIQIRGDQTLQDFHDAIFDAFGRWEQHAYEFQFGKGPMDPQGPPYVLPGAFRFSIEEGIPAAGRVDQTSIDSLSLEVGDRFGYWFDFGEDWWHQINVEAIEDRVPRGNYPRVTKRRGRSPPQYVDWEKEGA